MPTIFVASETGAAVKLGGFDADSLAVLVDPLLLPGGQPPGSAYGVAINPAETLLAVSHATTPFLSVYNTATWAKVTLAGGNPAAQGNGVAFNPAGTLLAVAHNTTPYLTIYNTSTWAKAPPAGGNPTGTGRAVAFNPAGTLLAVAHATSPYLTVYNTSTWAKVTLTGGNPGSDCGSVSWSADGAYLAVTHSSSPYLTIYNTSTWTKVSFTPAAGLAVCSAWSPNGAWLVTGMSGTDIVVYNTADWSTVSVSGGLANIAYGAVFSADSSKLYLARSGSPRLVVYDTATWTYTSATGDEVTGSWRGIALRPSSPRRVGTSGADVVRDDTGAPAARTVRIYSRDTGALLANTASDAAGAYSVPFFSDVDLQVVFLDDAAGTEYNDKILGKVKAA